MGEDKGLTHCRSRKNIEKEPFVKVIRSEALKHERPKCCFYLHLQSEQS